MGTKYEISLHHALDAALKNDLTFQHPFEPLRTLESTNTLTRTGLMSAGEAQSSLFLFDFLY